MTSDSVCAVVVTYNRRELLKECLDALLGQTRPLDRILVIDNASTDGTPEELQTAGYLARDAITFVRLTSNMGGAGGFHHGFAWAYEHDYEWIWAMDDDTIVNPDALEKLFAARSGFAEKDRPDLLHGSVAWIDGTPHPMNQPWPKARSQWMTRLAEQHGVQSIRGGTFVTLLFRRRFIKEFGLPLADYFIWSDDIEYTGRILRHNFGVFVPQSRAIHKTARKYTAVHSTPARFYYHVRNTLWMLTRSSAWTGKERALMIWSLGWVTASFLKRSDRKLYAVKAVIRGGVNGLFRSPRR